MTPMIAAAIFQVAEIYSRLENGSLVCDKARKASKKDMLILLSQINQAKVSELS